MTPVINSASITLHIPTANLQHWDYRPDLPDDFVNGVSMRDNMNEKCYSNIHEYLISLPLWHNSFSWDWNLDSDNDTVVVDVFYDVDDPVDFDHELEARLSALENRHG